MSSAEPAPSPAQPVGFAAAMAAVERALGVGQRCVKVLGAAGAVGPAVAAQLAQWLGEGEPGKARRQIVYLVADEGDAEERVADLGFFLPERTVGDDPTMAAAVEHLPAEG